MGEVIVSESSHLSSAYQQLSDTFLEGLVLEEHEFDRLPRDPPLRHLPLDDNLFHEGELKTHVYKVESGVICVSASRLNRPPQIVEFVFPGNLIGLGFLKRHIHNAKAAVDSCVSCWPLSAIPALVEKDATAKQRQAEATEREFAYRRNALVGSTQDSPAQRVAAFLVAVSQLNEIEGRDPNVISDSLHCGVVANYLGLDVDTLGQALVELEKRELVEQCPSEGLRLCDPEKLGRGDAR